MKIDLITRSEFEELYNQLNEVKTLINNLSQHKEQFINSTQVCEMLQISHNTLSTYRKKGIIPFITMESKHYLYEPELVIQAIKQRGAHLNTTITTPPRFT